MVEPRRHDVDYSRRHDGLINVWAFMYDMEEGWAVVGVHKTHDEALQQVRKLRAERKTERDKRQRDAKLKDAADHEPAGGDEGRSGHVQLGC